MASMNARLLYYVFMFSCGFFWIACYCLAIRRGFLDRSFAIPIIPTGINISWEFVFSFIYPHAAPMRALDVVCFGLDLIILLQVFRYWRADFGYLPKLLFYPCILLSLAFNALLVIVVVREFGDRNGVITGYAANIIMSAFFLLLVCRRQSPRGQSLYIAICRVLGTTFSVLAYGVMIEFEGYPWLICLACGLMGVLIDAVYISIYFRVCLRYSISPISRW